MGFTFASPTVVAGTVLVVEAIQSQNYAAGISGWYLAANGDAEIGNLTARGSFISGSGTGAHLEILTSQSGAIRFFTGNPAETSPGLIIGESSATVGLHFGSPVLGAGNNSSLLALDSASAVLGISAKATLTSDRIALNGPVEVSGTLSANTIPVATTTETQTLTNKTLTSPTITGSGPITAGSLNLGLGSTVNDVQFGSGSFTVVVGGLGRINVPHTLGVVPTVAFVTFQNSTQVGTADLGLSTATTVVVNVRNITAAGALVADGTVVVCRYLFII